MSFNYFEYSHIAVAVNAIVVVNFLILLMIVVSKAGKHRSGMWLSFIFLTPLFIGLNNLTLVSEIMEPSFGLLLVTYCSSFLFPMSIIYFYRSFTGKKSTIVNGWAIMGYVMIVLCFGLLYLFTEFSSDQFMQQLTITDSEAYGGLFTYSNGVVTLATLVALIYAYTLTRKVKNWSKKYGSDYNQLDGVYLNQFAGMLILLNVFPLFMFTIFDPNIVESIIYPISMILGYILIMISIIRNSRLLRPKEFLQLQEDFKTIISNEQTLLNQVSSSNKEEYVLNQLMVIIKEKKLYKIKRLSIANLSLKSDRTIDEVTCAIKYGFEGNFFDFVNKIRIDQAILLMERGDSEKYTLETIGDEVGFNSRTTFYRAFKKYKGCSPGKWKKKNMFCKTLTEKGL